MTRPWLLAALAASMSFAFASPAAAAVITITQAKANAGGITEDDDPGFPITLSRPGAYRLETNLTVPFNKNGIQITSNYVDIDMNGFRLSGFDIIDSQAAKTGIVSTFGISSIHDGIIIGFKLDGMRLTGNSNAWVVRNMQILNNGGDGISAVDSDYLLVSGSLVLLNGETGIWCRDYCHVEGSNVSDNEGDGIHMDTGTALGNTIFSNAFRGIYGNDAEGDVGAGNNTVMYNNPEGGGQTFGVTALQPNACKPTPCN